MPHSFDTVKLLTPHLAAGLSDEPELAGEIRVAGAVGPADDDASGAMGTGAALDEF